MGFSYCRSFTGNAPLSHCRLRTSQSTRTTGDQPVQTAPGSTQAPVQEAEEQASPDSIQTPAQQQEEQTAPGQDQDQPGITSNGEPEPEKPGKKLEIFKNGSFEMGHYGWSQQAGKIVTEENGNKCMSAKYSWGLYQFLQVLQGETYEITCRARQDQEPSSPARMCIIFYSKDHKIMKERTIDIIHIPGTQWENFPYLIHRSGRCGFHQTIPAFKRPGQCLL